MILKQSIPGTKFTNGLQSIRFTIRATEKKEITLATFELEIHRRKKNNKNKTMPI